MPQQIGAALKDRKFLYPGGIERRCGSEFQFAADCKTCRHLCHAMLAGRTQSDIPDAADNVFVSAIANGKVYVAYGSIDPKVQVPACIAIRAGYDEKAENAYKRCFAQRAPQQPSFADATKQAQAMLAAAMGR